MLTAPAVAQRRPAAVAGVAAGDEHGGRGRG
jgi:hypothetical protein